MNSAGRYTQARGVVFSELSDGRGVLLSVEDGLYFTLNPTGREVWRLLATPATVGEVSTSIADLYGVEVERASEDVALLLKDLSSRGLAVIAP